MKMIVPGLCMAAVVAAAACDGEIPLVDPESVITFTDSVAAGDGDPLRADGASEVLLEACVAGVTTGDATFRASSGGFRSADGGREVTVPLLAAAGSRHGCASTRWVVGREPGTAILSARVGRLKVERSLVIDRAFPDSMFAETSSGFLKVDGSAGVKVTALLRRDTGAVTPGTRASFRATQTQGGQDVLVGRWTGLAGMWSDAAGLTSATLFGDTASVDLDSPVRVTVSVPTDEGGMLVLDPPILLTPIP